MNIHFDQPIILQRSPRWSRAIVWGLMSVTTFSVLWACFAKLEEAIPATGKLEPQGAVKEVKVPLNGVVKAVQVKDGQRVKQGDLLLMLDPTAAQAQLTSLQKIRETLLQENEFYRSTMTNEANPSAVNRSLKLPVGLAALTKSRSTLMAESQLYRTQLSIGSGANLDANQQMRLRSAQSETASRAAIARLEVDQLERQLTQVQVQRSNAENNFKINQQIYQGLAPVAKAGGVSKIQFLKQQQEVQTKAAEVAQFVQEQERIKLVIAQSQQKLQNTLEVATQEVLNKIAQNDKQIAEIDSQLNKVIVENGKRIAEIDNQLSQTQMTLKYQEVRAPVDGIVFDLKATGAGFVANSAEPVLKVVPDHSLQAEIFLTNKDIGFVKPGMPVDVRVDSFPLSEFGDIKGELVSVGSDALPPSQIRPFYTFPARIQLNQQSLRANGRELPLRSGMAISVNIKVRDRRVISILTDGFTQQIEHLKSIR